MAALTSEQLDLASSLVQDDLPTKLRCAICSKLAVNAYRLPCCETAICQNCQSTLPPSCPVCEHSPVSAGDCTVYKSLRTTIKVFLKTEEKKREAARPKANGSAPTTPLQSTPTPASTQVQIQLQSQPPEASAITISAPDVAGPEHVANGSGEPLNPAVENTNGPNSEEQALAADSIKPETTAKLVEHQDQDVQTEGARDSETQALPTDETPGDDGDKDDTAAEAGTSQSDQAGMSFGFDSMNNNFNMNMGNGDMNQMQMMMAMQNGMNPAAFGTFPMMGMMDPMMMQNMMMSGGFNAQGMGMNGMNMNMGMGMSGFGGNDDWNGQQSWNVAQDNFNPNAPGMGNGDFGNFNANFRTGNYGHHNQYNDYRRGGYGFRGRGRGRGFHGGYGRGGYHQNYNNNNNVVPAGGAEGTINATAQSHSNISSDVDEFGRTLPATETQEQNSVTQANQESQGAHDAGSTSSVVKDLVPASDTTHGDKSAQDDNVSTANGYVQMNGSSSGSAFSIQGAVPDVPLNAPTGPKAMRQGLPNTSLHNLRARGYMVQEEAPRAGTAEQDLVMSTEERPPSRSSSLRSRREPNVNHLDHAEERDIDRKDEVKDGATDRGRSPTRSVSKPRGSPRNRSRDRKESRRHGFHRSRSVSVDTRNGDSSSKNPRSSRQSTREVDDVKVRSRRDKLEETSRSASPSGRDYKRSSNRGRRERSRDRDRDRVRDRDRDRDRSRDRDRDRDRGRDRDRDDKRRDRDRHRDRDSDRDRDRDRDRHRKSKHRSSHRDRNEGRERDRERVRDRDSLREKDRSRDRETRERRHESKRSTNAPPTPKESSDRGFNPPTGPRGSFSIKGAGSKQNFEIKGATSRSSNSQRRESQDSRRPSQSSAAGQRSGSGASGKDPHTLEREARDRERLLKEAQRIAGMASLAGRGSGKRSRDVDDDRGGRRKSRRDTDDEERMRRVEAERDARRWD
ncbi:hypothetical protein F5Y18DRAFT_374390 [Xylariaceae sp. FL1019]|nr:hypothetical protein F5Y18DRAFT_374390 [Xylariaceae sp. FL1019]